MQVVSKIDYLITELTKLKPTLSEDWAGNEKKFNDLLTANIMNDHTVADEEVSALHLENAELENGIPSWVDPDYGYDPQNPRKPNKRELMEAISGKSMEDLYAEPFENYLKINRQAADMLHGVVGSNLDTRDWSAIMSADNILEAARKETGKMYSPEINIKSDEV